MTTQLVTLGTKIKFVTSIEAVKKMPYASRSKFQDGQEYLIVGYSHWDTEEEEGGIIPRLNLAKPDVLDKPLVKRNPELYFQNGAYESIMVDNLRRVQVEVLGSTAVSVPANFVEIAIKREFLPAVKSVRPGFSPCRVELVKGEEGNVFALLYGRPTIKHKGEMVKVDQPYKVGLRPRRGKAVKKAPASTFYLDVINGPK